MNKNGRSGILACGTWLVDRVKSIDVWPKQDTLCLVKDCSIANGGCAYNVLKDLAALGVNFPLEGAGLIGDDESGRYILKDCKDSGIETSLMKIEANARTPSTDVMTEISTARRTFFFDAGCGANFDLADFEIEKSNAKILLCGYIGLLPKMDFSGGHARAFARAKNLGFETAADFVSSSADLRSMVSEALPHIDYLSLNELEAAVLCGKKTPPACSDISSISSLAKELFESGVGKFIIVHFKEGAHGFSKDGEYIWQPAAEVPREKIRGANGCGDALFAGFLKAVHDDCDYTFAMKLGGAAAASCLMHETASGGILKANKCLKLL